LAGAVSIQASGALRDVGNFAKFVLANAARNLFRTVLIAVAGVPFASSTPDMTADDLSPGSFIVSVESTATSATRIGNLLAIYDVELVDPGPDMGQDSVELLRVTTTPAALSLQTVYTDGMLSGDIGQFFFYNNSITFLSSGVYVITMNWLGSTPVPGALTMVDSSANNALDSRAGEAWDFSAGALSDNTTGQVFTQATATGSLHTYKFAVRPGDVLTIPTLGSGTMTSLAIRINPAAVDLSLQP
jgi:hypothetical protein